LSKFHSAGVTVNIEGRSNRDMESGQHQYICHWNCDLHIYTIREQLRNAGFYKHHNRWQHLTRFSNNSQFILPEFHGAAATTNIEGRNNRNLESGQYQYICPWNGDLHIYTLREQLCDTGFFKRYNCWQHLTNI
jgi:hypothetical protein